MSNVKPFPQDLLSIAKSRLPEIKKEKRIKEYAKILLEIEEHEDYINTLREELEVMLEEDVDLFGKK